MSNTEISKDDILKVALCYYLKRVDRTPFDALLTVTDNVEWKNVVMSLIPSNNDDVYNPFDIITDDCLNDKVKLHQKVKELNERTETIAFMSGMLCAHWLSESKAPYQSSTSMKEACDFISSMHVE